MSTAADGSGSGVTHRPAIASQGLTILSALVAITLLDSPTNVATTVAVLGATLVVVGVFRANLETVDHAVAVQLGAVVLGALEGLPPGTLVAATVSILVGWDVARYGVLIGEQLGAEVETTRLELAHAAYVLGIGIGAGVVVLATYRIAAGTGSSLAVALLVGGAFAVVLALR